MTPLQVKSIFPDAKIEGEALKIQPYAESDWRTVTAVIKGDSVESVEGFRLAQGDQKLLNERSTYADVEALFGRLNWVVSEKPNSHGTSRQATRGNLLIKVHWLPGMTPEEGRISSLTLFR
jgi:hypothetical protein